MADDFEKLAKNFGIRSMEDAQALTRGFDLGNVGQFTVFDGKKADEGTTRLFAASLAKKIAERFQSKLGRAPSQGEIAGFFNNLDFVGLPEARGEVKGDGVPRIGKPGDAPVYNPEINLSAFVNDPKGYLDYVFPEHIFTSRFKALEPNFKQITLANNELKKYGETLPDEIASQIIAGGVSPEAAQELTSSYIKSIGERKVQEELGGLAGRQDDAITQLDKTLRESQSAFFNQDLMPQITGTLNARGLLNSGSLEDSLAQAGAKLNRERQNVIAPLRAQTSLDAQKKSFENVLRGALESGQDLAGATNFARNLFQTQQNQAFTASQNQLGRQFQDEQFRQQQALMMAMQGQGSSPSGLDYFLSYGLPVLGSVAGSFLGPMGTAAGGALAGAAGQAAKRA